MKQNRLELEQKLEEKKNRIGLVGTRLDVNEVSGNSFSAGITHDFRLISLNYGKDLDLVQDKQTKRFVELREIEDPEEKIGEDVLEHETGHRENPTETRYGCPHTAEIHDALLDAITRGLSEKGKQGLEHDVCNAFEDILDNVNCMRKTDFSGQTLFWNNQGLVNAQEGKYSSFYEAFVKLNLILSGKASNGTLLRRFYTNDEKVQEAVKSFLDYFKSQFSIDKAVRFHERPEFQDLFNTDLEKRTQLWEDLAYNFAVKMADLLDKSGKEKMFGFEENPFDQEIKIPKVKQEIAYKRYKAGKQPALHRETEKQLYDLYKRISCEIKVETSHFTQASGMPLVHFGRRFANERDRKIRFRGIGVNENGKFGIKTTRHNLQFPVSYKIHPRRFPNLKIALIDRSGSMALNPDNGKDVGNTSFIPWGDNSKYHFALKGYFGIDNFLDSQGISPYVDNCVLGFSGEQAVKGKARDVGVSLLTKPSGGTSLDIDGLENELEDGCLTLSISDGEFSLDEETKGRLKGKISNVDYAHIQIGQDTEYSGFLREIGVPVFSVRGDDDLSKVMVNFVSNYYKSQPIRAEEGERK